MKQYQATKLGHHPAADEVELEIPYVRSMHPKIYREYLPQMVPLTGVASHQAPAMD